MRRRQPTSTFKQTPRTPGVTFQPRAYAAFGRGVNLLANVMRPTLGPIPRVVAVEPVGPGDKRPELLDSGGTIARRFLQTAERDADMGAMFLRHVLWSLHERVGDGAATAAVIFQSVYNQGVRAVASGCNAMRLRANLECGRRAILEDLEGLARPLSGREQVAQIAAALCQDEALADTLAEIVETVSEHGAVDVRSGRTRELERQYVLGSFFNGKPLASWMLDDEPNRRAELRGPAVLVSDLILTDPADLVPLLRLADEAGAGGLLLLAREISEPVSAALHAAGRGERSLRTLVVKAPDAVTGQAAMLDDIAALTGARALLQVAGDSLRRLRRDDLGWARRAWSDDEHFGIISGRGDPRAVRAHVASLRKAFEHTTDQGARAKLRDRIGRMLGGSAVLWVGGLSATEIAVRKELASRTLDAIRATVGRGVLPGGGAALLDCRPRLRRMAEAAEDWDARVAYQILARALEEPARVIMSNAGYETGRWMGAVDRAGPGHAFDVRAGRVAHMAEAGVIDAAGVVRATVHAAVASAALALTIDVLVHTRLPELSFEP